MQYQMIMVAVAALKISASNVRNDYDPTTDKGLPALAASLSSVGMIQPVAVQQTKNKKGYEVLAGQRRYYAALAANLDEIPAMLFARGVSAAEISLAENYTRENMKPVQIYQAFAAIRMERPKITYAELGAMFAYDEKRVARIMRLAFLHPDVMQAYAAGEITDEIAMIFASTADNAVQLTAFQAWQKLPAHDRTYPHRVRALIDSTSADDRAMLEYVGLEAYREAGGIFDANLFAEEETKGRILSPEILVDLTTAKVVADQAAYIAGLSRAGRKLPENHTAADLGLVWIDQPPQILRYGCMGTDYDLKLEPKQSKLTDDQKARIAEINVELARLEEEAKAADVADDEDALEAIEATIKRFETERETINDSRTLQLPKGDDLIQASWEITGGRMNVRLWKVRAKGAALPAGSKTADKATVAKSPHELQRLAWGLTKDPMQAMLMMKREMLQGQLHETASAGSTLALDFLLFSQVRTMLTKTPPAWSGGQAHMSGAAQGIFTPAEETHQNNAPASVRKIWVTFDEAGHWHRAVDVMQKEDFIKENDPVVAFGLFRRTDDETKNRCAAIVAAHTLMASTSYYGDGRMPRMLEALGVEIMNDHGALPWYDTAVFDTAFFAAITHKGRLKILEEWGLADRGKVLKAGESAAFCARVIKACRAETDEDERDAKLLGINEEDRADIMIWVPEWLQFNQPAPLPVVHPDADDLDAVDDELRKEGIDPNNGEDRELTSAETRELIVDAMEAISDVHEGLTGERLPPPPAPPEERTEFVIHGDGESTHIPLVKIDDGDEEPPAEDLTGLKDATVDLDARRQAAIDAAFNR